MSKAPAFQFYVDDWLGDEKLRLCSHASKGVWADMLCLAWKCDRAGVFVSGGRVWTEEQLVCGIVGNQDVTRKALRELVEFGVCHRSKRLGAYFNARMVRDRRRQSYERNKKRRQVREAGRGRGNSPGTFPPVSRQTPEGFPPVSRRSSSPTPSPEIQQQQKKLPIAAAAGFSIGGAEGNRRALVEAGVGEPKASELAVLPGVCVQIIRDEARKAKSGGKGVGAMILNIEGAATGAVIRATRAHGQHLVKHMSPEVLAGAIADYRASGGGAKLTDAQVPVSAEFCEFVAARMAAQEVA